MKNDKTLSVREASALLRVSLKQVYNLVWDGRLRGQKIDGVWRIPKEAVHARLSQRGGAQ